jgi:hypothetical protein
MLANCSGTERRGKEEMTTAESERIPDPTAVIKNNAKPK